MNALCFIGGIGNKYNSYNGIAQSKDLVDWKLAAKINNELIIKQNNCIDIFVHCWTKSIKNEFIEIYKPKNLLFEDNSIYEKQFLNKCYNNPPKKFEFNRVSFLFSIKQSLNLLINYSKKNNILYEKVIIYRPDVVINKPFKLHEFDTTENLVICNNGVKHLGDFHYVMNFETATKFMSLYDNIDPNIDYNFKTMPKDIAEKIGLSFYEQSNFIAGQDQEVLRKCRWIK